MNQFPDCPEAIEPAWLTDRLVDAGLLASGRVSTIEPQSIGTGQVGESVRFKL